MKSPDWVEDRFEWEHDSAWYKRLVFRTIVDPIDDFYCWRYRWVINPWHDLQNAIMRVKKGHDYSDVWNMNSWFINNAVPILEHWLAHPPMGNPVMDDEDGVEMTYDKWISILNEMLDGFKLYKMYESSDAWPSVDLPPCPVIEGRSSVYHDDAHYMIFDGKWLKTSMTKTEHKKFKRSLYLFCKYFEGLWD
jgi:hypothetical protein